MWLVGKHGKTWSEAMDASIEHATLLHRPERTDPDDYDDVATMVARYDFGVEECVLLRWLVNGCDEGLAAKLGSLLVSFAGAVVFAVHVGAYTVSFWRHGDFYAFMDTHEAPSLLISKDADEVLNLAAVGVHCNAHRA
eukprot:TRINITY_DN26055_c0_g1_i1.p1 TRINITY_DN26055_c0_g1~~TRINITY_DN26055_c0_g1_i1.p1  ORF type:complete len:138 (-),score=29.64 TRINITY_DN26055_c0_g1_i1:121-534(-)